MNHSDFHEPFKLDDENERSPMVVVVLDRGECRLGAAVEYDAALTLWATMSEDPATWDEVVAYWPRYRCPVVSEFADALPIEIVRLDKAQAAMEGHGNWIVFDLLQKRVITGCEVQQLGREATLALVMDEKGNQHCPLPFRLPPWWELFEHAEPELVLTNRMTAIHVPRTNRTFLSGEPMVRYFAERILRVFDDGRLPDSTLDERDADNAIYRLTVEIHRDWLMTARDDLDGRRPRDLLHGAHRWSDSIVWGQRMRFEDGSPIVAAPDDVVGYVDAPMGSQEMYLYFDLCREVIDAGWFWCKSDDANSSLDHSDCRTDRLVSFLHKVRDSWLEKPFGGGSPPSFIIECSRRRVPRGSQVPIVGMDREEGKQHVPDCDCPICDMMASGMFGVGFTSIDGHHLEIDNEFAFSTHEFIEDWEREQEEYRLFSAEMDRRQAERNARIAAGEREEDVYASAWSSPMSDAPIPGDPMGHFKLSFRLAEIICNLEQAGAPNRIIKDLNVSFRDFRENEFEDKQAIRAILGQHLDAAAYQYPNLLAKISDFQSQLDEQLRASL